MRRLAGLALLLLVAAGPAPQHVASLDLCADELVLALAAPGQLVSVSRLGADPRETALAGRARGLATNNGRLSDVIGLAPDLVVTMGGTRGALAGTLAARLGTPVLALPVPQSIAEVRANVRRVAAALGRPAAADTVLAEMDSQLGTTAPALHPAVVIGGGGLAPRGDGLAGEWLAHAGLRQSAGAGTVTLERLLADPPPLLVTTRYHDGEASLGALWLQHPALAALPPTTRRVSVDGRAWTCLGPQMAGSIAALRQAAR